MIGLDVVVADREQREGTVLRELRVAGDDGLPGSLYGATVGKVQVHLLLPGRFTIPGEQVNPDTHDAV